MTKGSKFDDFLKDENIEIDEEKIKENIKQMTDKEIIIDGVDVAGCKYLNKVVNEEPYCNIDEEHLYTCSSDENCYYKQLKQLEQENAELKAENERLKEKILKFRWDNPYFDLYNNVVSQRDMWEQKSKQYKQTLQEIKAIADARCNKCKYEVVNMAIVVKQSYI